MENSSTMCTIPKVPLVPLVPKVPIQPKISNNTPIKKLKSLNLKEFTNSNQKNTQTQNSIFNFTEEITLKESLIEEFFKINDSNSTSKRDSESITEGSSDKKAKKEVQSAFSLIDKNKFTAIYVSIRKLNSKVKFNLLVENIHKLFTEIEEEIDSTSILEEMLSILLAPDIVSTIYSILPTENERKLILNEISSINIEETSGDAEKWLLKCCECEQIRALLEILMSLFDIQTTITQISSSLDLYLEIYSRIVKNKNLKLLLNIILRIDNHINKETGRKQLSHFDIRNLDTLSDLRINSKNFLQFVFKIYTENLAEFIKNQPTQKDAMLFENKENSLLVSLLEPYNSLNTLSNEINRIKEEVIGNVDKLQNTVKNKFCLNKLSDILCNLDDQLQMLIRKLDSEKEERQKVLEYFHFPSEGNQFEFINLIFKNLLNLGNKLQYYIKELPITLYKEKVPLTLNKSRIKHNSSSEIENPEIKVKSIHSCNNTHNKNNSASKSVANPIKSPLLPPSSLLSLKYKLK